jgi:hypothetical protein
MINVSSSAVIVVGIVAVVICAAVDFIFLPKKS